MNLLDSGCGSYVSYIGYICHCKLLEIYKGWKEREFFYYIYSIAIAPDIAVVVKVDSSFLMEPGVKDIYWSV